MDALSVWRWVAAMIRVPLAILLISVVVSTACSATTEPESTTRLRVLASTELADMQPLLDDLRRDTGIKLDLDYQDTVDASEDLTSGRYNHDLAWLSSDRYFRLKLAASRSAEEKPLSTNIMSSPLVIGLKQATAERLRATAPSPELTWADIANAAAQGTIRFGMADPRHSNSGLAALVGVATAAAGKGNTLGPEDVGCDRLRGFFSGQTVTEDTSSRLVEAYIANQADTDALITYESELLSLNASGKLRAPLEIVYPKDGLVLSEYPLLLLDSGKRTAYDKVVSWLTSEASQQRLMEQTLRRPVDPRIPRDGRLSTDIGNTLRFPNQPEVVDKLLANYGPNTPAQVIFLLDYSGSMRGARMAALRSTFAGLSGADTSSTGKFVRFYRGEKFTLIRFGGHVLGEQTFTIGGQGDVDAMLAFLASDQLDTSTAVWSALDRGYALAAEILRAKPGQPLSIVLMTDGVSNTGLGLGDITARYGSLPEEVRAVHTYAIRFGEANAGELDAAARLTGGRMIDATASSLDNAFKETRGCG
jgi:Ca-activated chloride channel family protein